MKLFTIGFTQKSAREFFKKLKDNGVELLLDIRLNNTSQLAGFAKGEDLRFFIESFGMKYIHDTNLSPTEEILKKYKKKEIDWKEYEILFNKLCDDRKINEYIIKKYIMLENICLLCSEATAEKCHRRLIANRFKKMQNDIVIVNL